MVKQDSSNANLKEELTEQDTVIDELNENIKTEDTSIIIIDSIIQDIPSNNIDSEEIEESNVAGNNDYILVVQVFSSSENAKGFIEKSGENLNYIEENGKFYVYA